MFSNPAGLPSEPKSPRKVDSVWEVLAPAKVNLYLEVPGPRADGFHALETLMVPVRLYDHLRWCGNVPPLDASPLELRVRNLLPAGKADGELLGADDDNLVLRAARLLARTAGITPRGRFELTKRIPIQAGMGGGSSDAAATLMLANKAWNVNLPWDQLMPLAAELGSDVPFFLNYHTPSHGAAVCRGRGELVDPIASLPKIHFVLVKPEAGLSTAEVFSQLPTRTETDTALVASSQARLSQLITRLQTGNLAAAAQAMTNRLEVAAEQMAPWLVALREVFSTLGSWGHFMTGSGSAYVGIMRSAIHARHTARRLANRNLGAVFATSSC